MKNIKTLQLARTLLRSKEKAVLSTHSVSKKGYPFGSMTTFITDYAGHPIIYISHLALHTRNIIRDPRLSLIVTEDNTGDINAGARLTILGKAKLIDPKEVKFISERFWSRFPESRKYQKTHDFKFYRIHIEHIRFIGGFGQIHWLDKEQFLLDSPNWVDQEKYAIDHMNTDHSDAMQLILDHFKNTKSDQVTMTHLYPDGCVIKSDNKRNHFVPYKSLAIEPSDLRVRLVELTQEARG